MGLVGLKGTYTPANPNCAFAKGSLKPTVGLFLTDRLPFVGSAFQYFIDRVYIIRISTGTRKSINAKLYLLLRREAENFGQEKTAELFVQRC